MEAGPSWNFDVVPTTHKCDLCLEHKIETPIQLNDNAAICKPCFISDLKPKFEAAKENEQFWPVAFGSRLHPSSFADFFTEDFIAGYAEKEKEYTTPIAKRVYCAASTCGKFLGSVDLDAIAVCSCGSKTCRHCKATAQGDGTHVCPAQETPIDPFEGLRLGHDYQRCPKCGLPVQLFEACNHITCRCGQEFCFVCGQIAMTGTSHWRAGGCPQYNLPGQPNAQYETQPQAHVDAVYHPVEQLRPDCGPPPALLAQAMDALAVDRPPPQQQAPRQVARPEPQQAPPQPTESPSEVRRRAANNIATRMGFISNPPRRRR